uniref:Uncharacterized protein n=1 Tax=viral metagenome TaxID=1070528 RepID=A0A6H1ZEG5_9ZZZZ
MKKLIPILTVLLFAGAACMMTMPAPDQISNVVIPLVESCIKSEYGDYSYQGHIDPQTITRNWTLLEDKCVLIGPGTMEMYYQNPKSPCEIPVAVFLVYQGAFLGYGYLRDGNVHLYLFDLDSKCYIGKQLEGEAAPLFRKKLGEALGMKSLSTTDRL